MMPRTARPTRAPFRSLACVGISGSALVFGCNGPLSSRDSDLGQRVPLDRVRTAQTLVLDQFRLPAPALNQADATPAAPGTPSAPGLPGDMRPGQRLAQLEKMPLSIEQCRADALRNNLELKVAVVDPAIAGEALKAEEAKFDAVFQPFARYANTDDPASPASSQQAELGLGVNVPLRTGGTARVDLAEAWNRGSAEQYRTDLSASLTQPLLRNAGRDVNVASITVASYQEQIASANTKLRMITELANTDRAYWRLYAVQQELQVRQKQYELAQDQLAKAQRRVRAGQSPEVEVTRAESGLASRVQGIFAAENAVLTQQRELKRLISRADLDLATTTLVSLTTQPTPVQLDFSHAADQLCALAVGSRMELLESELSILADTVNINVARNQTLPGLDVNGTYRRAGVGSGIDRATNATAQGSNPGFSLGVNGNIPLTNDAAEARYRQALLTRVSRLATRESRTQLVRQEVLDAIDRITSAWQRILAARQASILAGRTLAAEQRQFDVGSRTSTDVLDAAANLADAQSSEILALTEYQNALVDLAVATGTVLGASKVAWNPVSAPDPDGKETAPSPRDAQPTP